MSNQAINRLYNNQNVLRLLDRPEFRNATNVNKNKMIDATNMHNNTKKNFKKYLRQLLHRRRRQQMLELFPWLNINSNSNVNTTN